MLLVLLENWCLWKGSKLDQLRKYCKACRCLPAAEGEWVRRLQVDTVHSWLGRCRDPRRPGNFLHFLQKENLAPS